MGWGRFLLLGDLGQQLDLADRERDMVDLRERIYDQHSRDTNQDAQITALRQENDELKLYVGALVKLLASKGVITDTDVREMVGLVERSTSSRP